MSSISNGRRADAVAAAVGTDVEQEQDYVTRLYERLDALRDITRDRLLTSLRDSGTGHQARTERDTAAAMYGRKVAELDGVETGLYFGRLDMHDNSTIRLGRIGLFVGAEGGEAVDESDEHQPLLIDWRAPAARPFYLATAASPQGVDRRRHIRTRDRARWSASTTRCSTSTRPEPAADHDDLTGESALLAALTASRTGRMRDIVATIQAEQDRIIRADPAGVLVVQGGPGTGKTAVALHRAAYLLYTYRQQLATRGVLIVGPNATFLRYISQVLPSLAETGVLLRTLGDLFPGVRRAAGRAGRSRRDQGPGDDGRGAGRGRSRTASACRTSAIELEVEQRDAACSTGGPGGRPAAGPALRAAAQPGPAGLRPARARRADRPGRRADRHRPVRRRSAGRRRRARRPDAAGRGRPGRHPGRAGGGPGGAGGAGPALADPDPAAAAGRPVRRPDAARRGRARARPTPSGRCCCAPGRRLDPGGRAAARRGGRAARRGRRGGRRRAGGAAAGARGVRRGRAGDRRGLPPAATCEDEDESGGPARHRPARRRRAWPSATTRRRAAHHRERAAADRTWAFGHIIVDEAQELSPMAWRLLMRRRPAGR